MRRKKRRQPTSIILYEEHRLWLKGRYARQWIRPKHGLRHISVHILPRDIANHCHYIVGCYNFELELAATFCAVDDWQRLSVLNITIKTSEKTSLSARICLIMLCTRYSTYIEIHSPKFLTSHFQNNWTMLELTLIHSVNLKTSLPALCQQVENVSLNGIKHANKMLYA